MALYDGKCDEIGTHSRSGKLNSWELHKGGYKWLCDRHYQQYIQEEERKKKLSERLQRQEPQPISEPPQRVRRLRGVRTQPAAGLGC